MNEVKAKAQCARKASLEMATLTTEQKNTSLAAIAEALWREREGLIEANKEDLQRARKSQGRGELSEAIVERLRLEEEKVLKVVDMVRSVASLDDPIGRTLYAEELDKGLELYRVSSPIGVVGVVFESRPDVLPQIASLCLKSGNAVILKGGSEASSSNRALYKIIREAAQETGIPEGWIQLLEAREEVTQLLKLDENVDLLIPRGSNSLVMYIKENTRIPVLGHSDGVCHIYVDENADVGEAVEICLDAKTQYPSVCNAVDTLLIHKGIAGEFLPAVQERLEEARVQVRGCPETRRLQGDRIRPASDEDWGTEFLDYVVAVKVVGDINEAVRHVNEYGSHHTDAIITRDGDSAIKFMEAVDSASVFWNASTRFADGYRYGLGAEVGISTGRIHARGPTGLEGLTIYKYYLVGSGQIVSSYLGGGSKSFSHRPLQHTWRGIRDRLVKNDAAEE
jgi:glutamate-5-semialdehyde dehydrogenase